MARTARGAAFRASGAARAAAARADEMMDADDKASMSIAEEMSQARAKVRQYSTRGTLRQQLCRG
jgi:hypothetical protein